MICMPDWAFLFLMVAFGVAGFSLAHGPREWRRTWEAFRAWRNKS